MVLGALSMTYCLSVVDEQFSEGKNGIFHQDFDSHVVNNDCSQRRTRERNNFLT